MSDDRLPVADSPCTRAYLPWKYQWPTPRTRVPTSPDLSLRLPVADSPQTRAYLPWFEPVADPVPLGAYLPGSQPVAQQPVAMLLPKQGRLNACESHVAWEAIS